jgi:chromosomal replication initiation ATPase DnaA
MKQSEKILRVCNLDGMRKFSIPSKPLEEKRPYEIKHLVETRLQMSLTDENREQYTVDARSIFYFLCRRSKHRVSLSLLGAMVGKEHCTVLHHLKKFKEAFRTADDLRQMLYHVVGPEEYGKIEKELTTK